MSNHRRIEVQKNLGWTICCASLFTLLLIGNARAEILAYEGFDYPMGNLSGLNGGVGWDGGWTVGGDAVVVAGSLDYSDGANSLDTVGNHMVVGGTSGTGTAVRSMLSDAGLSPGSYWLSFMGQRLLPHPDTPNNYARSAAFQLQLAGSATTEQVSVGKVTTPTSGTVTQTWDMFSIQVNPGSITSTGVDQSNLVFAVMQVTIVGGTDDADDDRADLWLNPVLDSGVSLGTPDATNVNFDDYQFDALRLFAGGTTGDGLYAQLAIDEIRIGTTLADVFGESQLPNPGDTNGDFIVDIATDLTAISNNFLKQVNGKANGDLNLDGTVDYLDFRLWKDNFPGAGNLTDGQLNSLLTSLQVPEPSTGLLLMALWGCLGARRARSLRDAPSRNT